jgi:hypothetical protein
MYHERPSSPWLNTVTKKVQINTMRQLTAMRLELLTLVLIKIKVSGMLHYVEWPIFTSVWNNRIQGLQVQEIRVVESLFSSSNNPKRMTFLDC